MFVGFRLGRDCWVRVTMIAYGLLNFRHCYALRLDGKSQVGIIPSCVSSEGRIMSCCDDDGVLHRSRGDSKLPTTR